MSSAADEDMAAIVATARYSSDDNTFFTENEFVTICTIQICTGSISFLASLAMATSIQFSKRKLSTPYRRLVYGLCVADIFQSISIAVGPFAPPSETPHAFWARGNIATCNVNGLMLNIGVTAAPMYILALGVYYLCKLKRRMPDDVFRAKYEIWIHKFIILWHIIVNTILLFTRSFNPAFSGSSCLLTEFPYRCDRAASLLDEDEGKNNPSSIDDADDSTGLSYQRGSNSIFLTYLSFVTPLVVSFMGICCCMFQLLQHAFAMLKKSPPTSRSSNGATAEQKCQQRQKQDVDMSDPIISNQLCEIDEDHDDDGLAPSFGVLGNRRMVHNDSSANEESYSENNNISSIGQRINTDTSIHDANVTVLRCSSILSTENVTQILTKESRSPYAVYDLSIAYKREMITQALSFIGVFFLIYLIPFIRWFYTITNTPLPFELIVALVFVYPLGGMFYILVHNRTNVAALQRRQPQITWCAAFFKVFLHGGDAPTNCDDSCHVEEQKKIKRSPSSEDDEHGELFFSHDPEHSYDSDAKYSLHNFIDDSEKKCISSGMRVPYSHHNHHHPFPISQHADDISPAIISSHCSDVAMENISLDNMVSSESYGVGCLGNISSDSHTGVPSSLKK